MRRARTSDAKDKRRQALLDAALDEFFERGYEAARMDAVARRAELSKGTVYLYFDSKRSLFEALIESLTQPNIDQIRRIAETTPTVLDAIAGFAAHAPNIIQQSRLPRLMKVVIGDSGVFPEIVHSYRTDIVEQVLRILERLLERGVASGELRPCDTALTARLIIAPVVLSSIWEALFGADPEAAVDLDALFQLHFEFLSRALAPGNTEP